MARKRIALFGATGSIGTSTLAILRQYPEVFELVAIAAHSSAKDLANIAHEFQVPHACLSNPNAPASGELFPNQTQLHKGPEALVELASLDTVDMLVMAIVGTDGLDATLAAIADGKTIALASKELLVIAGQWIIEACQRPQQILPLDSEHSALFQCIQGHNPTDIQQAILTASGGALRDLSLEQMENVTPEQALKHPNWDMGRKVTIDSATLANKGLELFEAKWLFDLQPKQLQVVIHRQSLVHSMVAFKDGNLLAQICPPQMTFPIQYALFYPERRAPVNPPIDWTQTLQMDFGAPDLERFPALHLALEALHSGGLAPAIFHSANAIAVDAFCEKAIGFMDIARTIEYALETTSSKAAHCITEALETCQHAEEAAQTFIQTR